MIAAVLPFLLLALFAAPWFLLLRARSGSIVAALTVLVLGPILILVAFTFSSLLSLDPVLLTFAVTGAIGVTGFIVLPLSGTRVTRPSRIAVATTAGATLGGVVWLTTLVIMRLATGTAAVGWAMRGDSANNIHVTRRMFAEHGSILGTTNPVPLQSELHAIAAWLGRPDAPAGDQLAHDIVALSVLWALSIGAMGVAIGVIAASALPTPSVPRVAIVSGSASLLSATWFFSGLPIDSGYFNVHIALPFALGSWIAYQQSRRRPAIATLLLLGCSIALLTTWTPLVVFPVALIIVIAAQNWSRINKPHGPAAAPAIIAAIILSITLFVIYIPSLVAGLSILELPGHGYPFTLALLALGIVATIVLAAIPRLGANSAQRDGVIALGAASLAGLGFLVLVSRNQDIPWLTYYPVKFTWLATAIVLVIALSLLFSLVGRIRGRGRATFATAAVGVVALALASIGPSPDRENFVVTAPLTEVISGSTWAGGQAALEHVTASLNSSTTVVLWDSGIPAEAFVNYWVFEFSGAAPRDNNRFIRVYTVRGYQNLRDFGINEPTVDIEYLCQMPDHVEQPLTIKTADRSLSAKLAAQCPQNDLTIEVIG